MEVAVFRKEHFNAAHRLFRPDWSDEKNDRVFGKCNNPNFHGHNYELIVRLSGQVSEETGYVYDLKLLSDLIKEKVISKFDHKNLNLDTDEFKDLIPTAENIVYVIYQLLRPEVPEDIDMRLTLYETEKNFVEYPAK